MTDCAVSVETTDPKESRQEAAQPCKLAIALRSWDSWERWLLYAKCRNNPGRSNSEQPIVKPSNTPKSGFIEEPKYNIHQSDTHFSLSLKNNWLIWMVKMCWRVWCSCPTWPQRQVLQPHQICSTWVTTSHVKLKLAPHLNFCTTIPSSPDDTSHSLGN